MGRPKAENKLLVALRGREPSRKPIPPAPKGLSPKWLAEWNTHHEHPEEWERHESLILGHALIWWSREDDFMAKASLNARSGPTCDGR